MIFVSVAAASPQRRHALSLLFTSNKSRRALGQKHDAFVVLWCRKMAELYRKWSRPGITHLSVLKTIWLPRLSAFQSSMAPRVSQQPFQILLAQNTNAQAPYAACKLTMLARHLLETTLPNHNVFKAWNVAIILPSPICSNRVFLAVKCFASLGFGCRWPGHRFVPVGQAVLGVRPNRPGIRLP